MAYALVPRAPMMPMRGVACRRGAGFRGDVATGEVGASPPAWPRSLSRPDCGAPMGRFPSAWPPCLRYGVDERSGFSRQEMEGGQSRDRAKGRRERGRNAPPSGTHGTVAPSEGRGFPFAGEGWPYPWLLPGRSRVRSFLPSFLSSSSSFFFFFFFFLFFFVSSLLRAGPGRVEPIYTVSLFWCFACPSSGTSLFLNASKQEGGGLAFPRHWAC